MNRINRVRHAALAQALALAQAQALALALPLALVTATLPSAAWSAGQMPDPPASQWRPARAVIAQYAANSETLRVLTYTQEHCRELARRADELRARATTPHAEANLLATEGARLCAHGQLRPGIIRLRRAVVLLRGETLP
jgi:hypothetical protein